MNDFEKLRLVHVLGTIVGKTLTTLRKPGSECYEAMVLWAGSFLSEKEFQIDSVLFPDQILYRTSSGVGLYVKGDGLFRINRWLYDHEKVVLAQVHSHPRDAYHSETDNEFPVATSAGQFSIVIPDYARRPFRNLSDYAIYRLKRDGRWRGLKQNQISMIFRVI